MTKSEFVLYCIRNKCYWCGKFSRSMHKRCWEDLMAFALSSKSIPTHIISQKD